MTKIVLMYNWQLVIYHFEYFAEVNDIHKLL